ncbi:cytochrome c biogenesis protein ResB [Nocardioides convexus]|uniref:cytochrome c biogenesis protein ResB n=1 Tax=Nocardioides convexus TaxID=2712224 RepID=UPI002418AEF1|nr:cytochrome c biogenesis protein ResB [Nocardioides convexus]
MLLALAAIPGSLIPQQRVDARAVSLWKSDHPRLTPLFDRAGMFHVYGSAWFSAIYILLMVSLVGCIVPRLRVYWRALLARPPAAPRNLTRLPSWASGHTSAPPDEVAQAAAQMLRRQRFRRVIDRTSDDGSVTLCAQRGYLREAGNLLFHLSLVVVLVAFAAGDLFGYRGGVILVSGQTFTNARQSYDDFAPGGFFRDTSLDPFSLQLDDFKASFLQTGPSVGQPTAFSADVTYRSRPGASDEKATLKVNHPLTVDDTSVFLVGNGYAPVITVRDGNGEVAYSGPTVFLPENPSYASWGVVKVPDAAPTQLGFEGEFLPTYGKDLTGRVVSRFPDALAPTLSLTPFVGDLGLGSGVPQSVYALNKTSLRAVKGKGGKPLTLTIAMGETRELPDGAGSIRLRRRPTLGKAQVSSTPAEPLALGGVILGLVGLLGSLYIRPRRLWVRALP